MQSSTPAPVPVKLMAAVAHAQATDKLLHVVDESLRRSEEARKLREQAEAERREREAREQRIEHAREQEAESAKRLTERNERVAERIAERDAARADAQRALASGVTWPLNVVI